MTIILVIASGLLLFLQDTTAAGEISSNILVNESVSWDGGAFEYAKGKPKITIQKMDISTGSGEVSLVVHCHPIPIAAYVLKGSVKVINSSGENKLFKAGDAFIEVMNKWHKGIFVEDTELIVFYAGQKGVPLSVTKDGSYPLSKACK